MANIIEAEVVIVGSGVAGALIADKLASAGVKVAILEAGQTIDRQEAVQRYRNALVKVPESAYARPEQSMFPVTDKIDDWYRQRGPDSFKSTYLKAVGGTTWLWLGTCLRYLPNDFRLQSLYGQGVNWPLSYTELEPYYSQAERELGVAGDSRQDLDSPRSVGFSQPGLAQTYLDQAFVKALDGSPYRVSATPQARNSVPYQGRPSCCGSASCIPVCPVQAKYDATVHLARALKAGARLHEKTTAVTLELDEHSNIAGVRFLRWDRSAGVAKARVYVIACHAIETPRLLLNSRSDQWPRGIANSSDQVGRNLMDHPIQLSWALAAEPVYPYRGPISTSGIENLRDGVFRRQRGAIRIQISNDGWSWPAGAPLSTVQALAQQGLRGKALETALADETSRHLQLASLIEQEPDPANRITLHSHERDFNGVLLPQIDYRVGAYARHGLAAAIQAHQDIFGRLKASKIHHASQPQGAGHIIGTTRMGESPRTSVVDAELRSHDHANLYIAGSSVFPTGGTANPTLTIAALSLRTAVSIKKRLEEN
jgi:choline dehydrogenase-like flavoprotein